MLHCISTVASALQCKLSCSVESVEREKIDNCVKAKSVAVRYCTVAIVHYCNCALQKSLKSEHKCAVPIVKCAVAKLQKYKSEKVKRVQLTIV